jgi:hypothetical protein
VDLGLFREECASHKGPLLRSSSDPRPHQPLPHPETRLNTSGCTEQAWCGEEISEEPQSSVQPGTTVLQRNARV